MMRGHDKMKHDLRGRVTWEEEESGTRGDAVTLSEHEAKTSRRVWEPAKWRATVLLNQSVSRLCHDELFTKVITRHMEMRLVPIYANKPTNMRTREMKCDGCWNNQCRDFVMMSSSPRTSRGIWKWDLYLSTQTSRQIRVRTRKVKFTSMWSVVASKRRCRSKTGQVGLLRLYYENLSELKQTVSDYYVSLLVLFCCFESAFKLCFESVFKPSRNAVSTASRAKRLVFASLNAIVSAPARAWKVFLTSCS